MKSARHHFILVGFLCQGMAWDSPLYWLVAIALWALALGPLQGRVKVGPNFELAALIGGAAFAVLIGKVLGQSSHFFLGDGVLCLQLARMLRPLSRREKLASILMACFHFAVACTLAPDVRFLLLALAALILFPKSLVELQSEEFGSHHSRLDWNALVPIAIVAIALFVSVPRFSVGGPLQLAGGPVQSGGLLSSVIDPASGGYANSAQVLLQIEGKDLGYLKAMALSQFDGREWRADAEHIGLRPFQRGLSEEELAALPSRRVRVKNVQFLGRVLPVDGRPVAIRGKFFQKPLMNTQGVVECISAWNTANNHYEYWIDPNPEGEPLSAPMIRFYTQRPAASERLSRWLDEVTEKATNQMDFARRLERHLRSNYAYRIGAPALNRLNTLDDFLFEKREGHCERFASAMALLLRMRNIPTRVAIGYVPGPRSRFSEWRQVRFKDAHAWTEAWFPEVGWTSFDATPGGGGGPDDTLGITSFLESLDLVWYSHVISFDGSSQRELASHLSNALMAIPKFAQRNLVLFFLLLAMGFIPLLYRRARWRWPGSSHKGPPPASNANHFYARLLRILAGRGLHRDPAQTPLEFLAALRNRNVPHLDQIAEITNAFCDSHYGGTPLSSDASGRLEAALRAIESTPKKVHA